MAPSCRGQLGHCPHPPAFLCPSSLQAQGAVCKERGIQAAERTEPLLHWDKQMQQFTLSPTLQTAGHTRIRE